MNHPKLKKVLWVIPVLLAILVNQNVLQNGYGWDDENIIYGIEKDRDVLPLFFPRLLGEHPKAQTPYYRPMVEASYLADHKVWGTKPFGYHLSVWLAHIMNTWLVFLLAGLLLPPLSGGTRLLPLISASLFAVHPAHSEAVAWIAGRNDVFCTTFMLGSFLLYIQYRRSNHRGLLAASMGFFFFALLTKEVAIGLLVLFPLYDALFDRFGINFSWKKIAVRWLVPIGFFGLYYGMRSSAIHYAIQTPPTLQLLTEAEPHVVVRWVEAIGYYFKMMMLPYPHRPFIPELPLSSELMWLSLGLLVGSAGIMAHALSRRDTPTVFGLAWVWFTLAPAAAATALNLAAAPVAERYVYAPSVGFVILGAWWMGRAYHRLSRLGRPVPQLAGATGALLSVVVLTFCVVETINRNTVWKNPFTFWKASAASAPHSGYPLRALGVQYELYGKVEEAERYYKMAVAVDEQYLGPDHGEVATGLNNLAVLYFTNGRPNEAEPLYQRYLDISERYQTTSPSEAAINYHNLAVLYREEGRFGESEALFKQSIQIQEKSLGPFHPTVAAGLEGLGDLYMKEGRYKEAVHMFKEALAVWKKNFPSTHPQILITDKKYAGAIKRQGSNRSPRALPQT